MSAALLPTASMSPAVVKVLEQYADLSDEERMQFLIGYAETRPGDPSPEQILPHDEFLTMLRNRSAEIDAGTVLVYSEDDFWARNPEGPVGDHDD